MLLEVIKIIGIGAVILISGFLCGFYYRKFIVDARLGSAEQNAKRVIEDAKKEAQTLKKEAIAEGKEEIANLKLKSDEDIKRQRFELQRLENRILAKKNLSKKSIICREREQSIVAKEKEIDDMKVSLEETLKRNF